MTTPELSAYEDRTLYSTWQISFDHVKQQNELSAKLLHLWAYFDNQDLWFELLRRGNIEGPQWLQELTQDELSFNAAIRALCDHGLVEADSSSQERIESRGYSIHHCVHSWTIHVLNQEWDYDLAGLALRIVGLHIPRIEVQKSLLAQRRLLQHAARCSYLIWSGLVPEKDVEWACDILGDLYKFQGKLADAEKMYNRVVQGYEKTLGPDHALTLNTVNNLGTVYQLQFKLDKAEKMYQRALEGKKKVFGLGHESTLSTINNLGTIYADQGKVDEAEKMYQQALRGKEKALSLDNESTLNTINNLGALYTDQNKLGEAEEMLKRALQGYEKAADGENIYLSALNTISNLGRVYHLQGKPEEAEKMYHRVLQAKERVLGIDRQSTLDTVVDLAILRKSQGRLDDAEKMCQRVIQSYKNTDTLEDVRARRALGSLYEVYRLRRALFRQEVTVHQERLTNHCSDTIVAVTNLCEELGAVWPPFFGILGRMLIWVGEDDDAAIGLQHQIHPLGSRPEICGPACDGCNMQFISASMERFVCRTCEDVDLCDKCYKGYQQGTFIPQETAKNCKAHLFITVPRQEGGNLRSGSSSPNASLKQWLTAVRTHHQTASGDL